MWAWFCESEPTGSGPTLSETIFYLTANRRLMRKHWEVLVGAVGIEPTTFGLKGRCSTTELRP
jgi:hypothetical protein